MKYLPLTLILAVSLLIFFPQFSQADTTGFLSGKTPRIVGGRDAETGKWPWMAALIEASDSSQFCGGSLIHPLWVVSAGHCGYDYRDNPEKIKIIIGINDLVNDKAEPIGVKQIIVHKDYDSENLYNDIALFELERPVFEKTISIIPDDIELEGKISTIIGWGETYAGQTTILQEVSVPIISNLDCTKAFTAYNSYRYPPDSIDAAMLCAGLAEGGMDACYGDSGGPLMVQYKNQWHLAGLVSWGEGCAMPDVYGVYTRVSKFFDFINTYVSPFPPGDFNENMKLGLEDVIGILNSLALVRSEDLSLGIHGDFNNDNRLGLEDAVGVLQVITNSYN
ncbi:Serine protease trypsin domain-containing protein [Desulfonema limicola]|uniref:Serine protease trypsin domain-containing protein n=1 Tax=Desulfonema limicola TaxID=45656 RepID=A0A975BA61_9BACT|nr:serine protease [Desulfonema limicola]QTA81653.1 Serine protease trypsin domain-containing protein [Desulfonema limicola]